MKKPLLLVLVAALLAAAFGAAGYFYGQRASMSKAESVKPIEHAAAPTSPKERQPLYWTDPMVPGSRFDKPGKSPFMDMALEPVYAETAGTDTGTVSMGERTMQNMGVRTVKVEQGQLARRIATVGIVKPDEHRIESVHAHTAGWVEKVYVRAVGDPVRLGQPMFELYAPELVAAQEEYLLAFHHHDEPLMQAAEQKLHVLYFHEAELKKLQQTGVAQRRMTVYAPIGGVVSELMVRPGMAVTAGQPAYTLTNLSSVWVNAQVPEAQATIAATGTSAEVRFAALPGKVFKGKVEYLYPDVTESSRTLLARIQLANPGGLLRPNMVADVALMGGQGEAVPLVPREAVIETGTRKVVIVADGNGKFHAQDVVTGMEADGKVEILQGIGAGLEVVASGQFLIDSEANLRSALDRMQGAPSK